MKRRKGVTVLGALVTAFAILGIAAFVVTMLVISDLKTYFDFVNCNKGIVSLFTTFDSKNLLPNISAIADVAIFLILSIIWAIVDGKRGRKIVIFFICLFLVSTYAGLLYSVALNQVTTEKLTELFKSNTLVIIPVVGGLVGALAYLLSIVLFIVDLATGKVEKEETPTFIKEPTEEVKEGVFEEVQDENEVAKDEAPAEEKVEEAKVEEKEEAPAPVEEPVKEEKKPAKKAPAKKANKKAPAKKAEPKKEEAKKAEPKKEAPVEEKKADARKTQTILLTNEEGNTYAKAYHVSRRPELNKWQVKATGSDKALKLFNTQKEAIEYANQLAKNQNVSIRVHSKEGKIRKHRQ